MILRILGLLGCSSFSRNNIYTIPGSLAPSISQPSHVFKKKYIFTCAVLNWNQIYTSWKMDRCLHMFNRKYILKASNRSIFGNGLYNRFHLGYFTSYLPCGILAGYLRKFWWSLVHSLQLKSIHHLPWTKQTISWDWVTQVIPVSPGKNGTPLYFCKLPIPFPNICRDSFGDWVDLLSSL